MINTITHAIKGEACQPKIICVKCLTWISPCPEDMEVRSRGGINNIEHMTHPCKLGHVVAIPLPMMSSVQARTCFMFVAGVVVRTNNEVTRVTGTPND